MVRNKKKIEFRMVYYKFEQKWTNRMKSKLKEYEEIKKKRLEFFKKKPGRKPNKTKNKINVLSIKSLKSVFQNEVNTVTDQLNTINIYMNKSIMMIIHQFENILNNELKIFIEFLVPIFFKMLESKNDYLHVVADNVKYDVNNPHKILPKQFTDYFGNR